MNCSNTVGREQILRQALGTRRNGARVRIVSGLLRGARGVVLNAAEPCQVEVSLFDSHLMARVSAERLELDGDEMVVFEDLPVTPTNVMAVAREILKTSSLPMLETALLSDLRECFGPNVDNQVLRGLEGVDAGLCMVECSIDNVQGSFRICYLSEWSRFGERNERYRALYALLWSELMHRRNNRWVSSGQIFNNVRAAGLGLRDRDERLVTNILDEISKAEEGEIMRVEKNGIVQYSLIDLDAETWIRYMRANPSCARFCRNWRIFNEEPWRQRLGEIVGRIEQYVPNVRNLIQE